MNYYSVIACLLLGFLLVYTGPEVLGFGFLILGIILFFYSPGKKLFKEAKKEAEKAPGSFPEGKLKEYTITAGKKTAEYLAPKKGTATNSRDFLHKMPKVAGNVFAEIDKLFK
ncbi:MAG: hypothetical protein AABW59_00545 [archaeon]